MPVTSQIVADGSAPSDQHEPVRIDRTKEPERWRYVCPNGHTNWDRTNNHIWCRACRRQVEAGEEDISPEHWEIYDKQRDRTIPWSAVRVVDPKDRHRRPSVR